MQRIMGVFTRKRISVDTILAGPCEKEGCARVLLASRHPAFPKMVEHLHRVHEILDIEYIENDAEAFVLLKSAGGRKPVAGKADAVEAAISKEDGAVYVKAYGAL